LAAAVCFSKYEEEPMRIAESHTTRGIAVSDRPAGLLLGFLTVQQDAAGFSGGYLVTNSSTATRSTIISSRT
jgi:hypothetical protein